MRRTTFVTGALCCLIALGGGAGCKKDASAPSTPPAAPAEAPAPAAPAPLTADAIVDRAIEATGGLETLRGKLKSFRVRTEGIYIGMPFVMEAWWVAPDQNVMALKGQPFRMGYVGEECWSCGSL